MDDKVLQSSKCSCINSKEKKIEIVQHDLQQNLL